MSYILQVTKLERNLDYDEQVKEFKRSNQFGFPQEYREQPKKEIEKNYLYVNISEEEYQAIKKKVIEVS